MRATALTTLALVALLSAACNGSTGPTPGASAAPSATVAAIETEPPASEEPTAAPESEEPPPSEPPLETEPPASDEPGASASSGPGPAAACSGNDQNRDFFRAAASALDWTVYCAVLPTGWFVDSGQYRQAGGGRVEIAYRGPGGARLELNEGAFCTAEDGCVPAGSEAGEASFGDRTGAFVALDDGGWAVVVDRGEPVSWLAVGTGMDDAGFREIAGALSPVGG
jgi:hypothetical protein